MDDGTLTMVEDRVYADAATSARTTHEATPGVLIPVREQWDDGRTVTKYVGDPRAFIGLFSSPGESGRIKDFNRGA
jgi:hypothetical protein